MSELTAKEDPKRLSPTKETLRELYSFSGNRCAYPDCPRPILDIDGTRRGQICHIESAMPGGERFNPDSTNEERRHVSNLLLMCDDHHTDTNDVVAYPVERMRKIKSDHEARFREGWRSLVDEVKDWTQGAVVQEPTHMSAFFDFAGVPDDLTDEEKEETRQLVREFAASLRTLTPPARQTLYIIVNRGKPAQLDSNGGNFSLLPGELADATGQTTNQVVSRVLQLETAGFAYFDDDFDGIQWVTTHRPRFLGEWPTWADLKGYCQDYGALKDLIVDLRFGQLDG